MEKEKFSWKARGKSFVYAFHGIKYLFKHEHNARIHAVVAILTIAAGFLFHIKNIEWCIVAVCIGAVTAAEAVNTAIEKICDKVSPERNDLIGIAKDTAAGAVLLLAVSSVIAGLIIFIPYIIDLFS